MGQEVVILPLTEDEKKALLALPEKLESVQQEIEQIKQYIGREKVSFEEIEDYFNVGRKKIWEWINDGTLPCTRYGRKAVISREDFQEFINNHKNK